MNKPTKYDVIRVFPETRTAAGQISINPADLVKSFTLQNEGTNSVIINSGAQTITIAAGDSYVYGGFDNSVVSEFFEFTFSGAGTSKLVVSKQVILGQIQVQNKPIEC